jgi:hypothetical protein
MKRSLFTVSLLFSALGVACVGGPGPLPGGGGQDSDTVEESPFGGGSSSPSRPGRDGDDAPGSDTGGSSSNPSSGVGPSCKAYLECCEAAAAEEPQFEQSCASMKAQLDASSDPSAFESGCESAAENMRDLDYCD